MKMVNGMLCNDAGKEVYCGNWGQRCGAHCAMFEYRKNFNDKAAVCDFHDVLLHCTGRIIILEGEPEETKP